MIRRDCLNKGVWSTALRGVCKAEHGGTQVLPATRFTRLRRCCLLATSDRIYRAVGQPVYDSARYALACSDVTTE